MGRKKEENLEINREIRIIQNEEEEEGYFRETQKKEEFTMEERRRYNKTKETFRRSFEYC